MPRRFRSMGMGFTLGICMLISGLCLAFGFIWEQSWLIGLGLLGMALSMIYGVRPNWPNREDTSRSR